MWAVRVGGGRYDTSMDCHKGAHDHGSGAKTWWRAVGSGGKRVGHSRVSDWQMPEVWHVPDMAHACTPDIA